MAEYKILSEDYHLGIHQYLVDEVADLQNLPSEEIGSSALVASTADVYILNNKKEWTKLS